MLSDALMIQICHVNNSVNPLRDAEIIETELLLADLQTLEKKYEKTKRLAKNNEKKIFFELNLIEKLIQCCGNGLWVNTLNLEQEEEALIKSFHLLTKKPILYAANVSENDIINHENDNVKGQKIMRKLKIMILLKYVLQLNRRFPHYQMKMKNFSLKNII